MLKTQGGHTESIITWFDPVYETNFHPLFKGVVLRLQRPLLPNLITISAKRPPPKFSTTRPNILPVSSLCLPLFRGFFISKLSSPFWQTLYIVRDTCRQTVQLFLLHPKKRKSSKLKCSRYYLSIQLNDRELSKMVENTIYC